MSVKWHKEMKMDDPDTYTAEQDGYTAVIVENTDNDSDSELEIANGDGRTEYTFKGTIDACKKSAEKWLEPEALCGNCGWRGDEDDLIDDIYDEGAGHKYCPECDLSV
jgi:hypothetical protein